MIATGGSQTIGVNTQSSGRRIRQAEIRSLAVLFIPTWKSKARGTRNGTVDELLSVVLRDIHDTVKFANEEC